jgi:hypothetical protein
MATSIFQRRYFGEDNIKQQLLVDSESLRL